MTSPTFSTQEPVWQRLSKYACVAATVAIVLMLVVG